MLGARVLGVVLRATAAFALFGLPAQAQPAPHTWTAVGPHGVNGWPIQLVFDPSQPGVVYAGCDDTLGLARSDDGGATWQRLPAYGIATDAPALAVGIDGRVLAGGKYGHGLKVSTDGGQTFVTASGFETGYVSSVAIDPSNPLRAWATEGLSLDSDGAGGQGVPLAKQGAVYRSSDGGLSWSRLAGGLPSDAPFSSVYRHPAVANLLFVTRGADVWRSTDGGDHWTQVLAPRFIPGGLRTVGGAAVIASSVNPALLLLAAHVIDFTAAGVSVRHEIWRSSDHGLSWSATSAPASTGLNYYALAARPGSDEYYAFGFHDGDVGLIRSRGNAGTSWQSVSSTPNRALFGGTFDPAAPTQLLTGFLGYGVWRFDVQSEHWARSTTGLTGGGCDGWSVDAGAAGQPDRWFVSCGNTGLGAVVASSDDYGRSWDLREPSDWAFHGFTPGGAIENVFVPVLADRTAAGTLLLGGDVLRRSTDRGASWSPVNGPSFVFTLVQGADGTLYTSGYDGTVRASTDHGATFTALGSSWCPGAIAHVAVPRGAPAPLLAACASTDPALDGVYRFAAGSWQKLATPTAPEREQAWSVTIDPFDPNRLAVVYALDADNASPGPPDLRYYGAHVFVSHDGGAQWADITPPASCAIARTVLFLSDAPAHLVVGTRTADGTCPGVLGRLWESFDAGLSWRDATTDWRVPQSYEWIGEDPLVPGRLFLSSWYDGIYRWIQPPSEVTLVMLSSPTRIEWPPTAGVSGYDVARASLSALGSAGLTAFGHVACGLDTPAWDDVSLPAAGDGFGYLVRSMRRGDDGPWGISALDSQLELCPASP